MLGKLLKYELKASARTLLPLYAATLILALVGGISMAARTSGYNELMWAMANDTVATFNSFTEPLNGGINILIGFSMILVLAFCVAVTVLTIMSVVQRFNHGIAGNEGYLMFTLPVKHETLLASKLLGALVWSLASILVFFLVGAIIGGLTLFVEREFYDWALAREQVMEMFRYYNPIPSVLLTVLNSIVALMAAILTIYLAIMIGQMEQFNKYRVAVAVVAFFVVNWVFGTVETGLFRIFDMRLAEGVYQTDTIANLYRYYNERMGCYLLYQMLKGAACFFGTAWMMKKKLNL